MASNEENNISTDSESESQDRGSNRRQVKNMWLDPGTQVRTAAVLFGSGFIIVTLIFGSLLWNVSDMLVTLADMTQQSDELSDAIGRTKWILFSTYGFVMLSLLFGSIFLALTITHRYLGPMVQIRRHVRSLRDGNYDSIIVLRKNDEFRDIADDLNILAVKLKDIAKS